MSKDKKFSEADLVKEDIVNQPEITASEDISAPEKPVEKPLESGSKPDVTESHFVYTPDKAERDGKLLTRGVSAVYKEVSGQGFEKDQQSAVEELGQEFFGLMQELNIMPRWAYVMVLGGLLFLPFLPPALRLAKPKKPVDDEPTIKDMEKIKDV